MRQRQIRTFVVTAMLFTVSILFLHGCIPVEDLGEHWEQGQTDPLLQGQWKQIGTEHRIEDQYLVFEKNEAENIYIYKTLQADRPEEEENIALKVRTTAFGAHPFMMIRNPDEYIADLADDLAPDQPADLDNDQEGGIDGGIQRYTVEGDVLTLYYLDDPVLWKAIEEGSVDGKLPDAETDDSIDMSPPTLKTLDDKTLLFLTKLCDDERAWSRIEKYQRITDLEGALKVSRTYPATPDTLRNTTVKINQTDFEYFTDGRMNILQRHLQASPEWKVFPERDALIAYRREFKDGKWVVSLNGFNSRYLGQSHVQTRHIFRFSPEGGGAFANEANRSILTITAPDVGDVQLNLKSSDQGIESYLAVGKPGLWFEFFEQTNSEPRDYTRKALDELSTMMHALHEAEDEVKRRGFASVLMPKDGVIQGEPTLTISDSFQGGIFDVSARVNPGQPGTVFLKAFRSDTGEQLSEGRLKPKSQEYIGWSGDSNDLFLYNAHVTIYEGDWDTPYSARFELWIQPVNAPEIKLLESEREIVGWQR
jgi:hypothetical protein